MSKRYTDSELLRQLEQCEKKHGKVTTNLINSDDSFASASTFKQRFGTFSKAKQSAALDDPGQIHLTDERYEQLDRLLRNDERLQAICAGLVMGDANLNEDPGKRGSALNLEMTNKRFLDWVAENMDDICSNLSLKSTAADLAAKNREYGYEVNEDNYHDIYTLRTRRLPYFAEMRQKWYGAGTKVYPESLSLTPMVTKVWYCCDGSLVRPEGRPEYPVIYCANERTRAGRVESLFDGSGLSPNFNDSGGGAVQFRHGEATAFFDWIGDPLPGFEYKWPS